MSVYVGSPQERWGVKLRIALVGLLLVCSFCFGAAYTQHYLCPLVTEQNESAWCYYNDLNTARQELRTLENEPPKIVRVPVEVRVEILREVPFEVIKEVPVEVIKEVEVVKYHHITAREWESVEQFTEWYEEQEFTTLMPSPVYKVDCDDYSEWLQRVALQQGYPVSEALAKGGLYYGVLVNKHSDSHAGNLVLIGNVYYWVEPQPNMFVIKKICNKD